MAASNDGKNVLSSVLDARKVLPFTFLVLALLVALSVNSISRHNDLLRSQELVERTHRVLHEIDRTQDSLQEAREAWLHYINTPEQQDLTNFDGAAAETWARLDRISQMTMEDESYPERMAQLRDLVKAEFQQYRDNMRTIRTLLIFHSPATDANRERVRAAMQKLKDDEEKSLRVRNDEARARASNAELSVIFLISGCSVLVAVLLLLVILESRKPRNTEPLQQLPAESMAAAAGGDRKN